MHFLVCLSLGKVELSKTAMILTGGSGLHLGRKDLKKKKLE